MTNLKLTVKTQKIREGNQSISPWKIISPQRKITKKEEWNKITKQLENNNVAIVSPYLSVITLNVNGLNFPIKDIE